MSRSKGLSQILYLIIAASVLMIAALSMVFMLNEGLSGVIDFGGEAEGTGCETAVEAACAGGASTVSTPSACLTENADGDEEVISGALSEVGEDEVSCNVN
ncbi:MAG: hypothetical protein R6V35_03195 [Candidatus Nanohaloarchaea archaeon]